MKSLRALTIAGVVGATSLGGGLVMDLAGLSEGSALGQAPYSYSPTPSTLVAPNGYPSTTSYTPTDAAYNSRLGYNAAPSYSAAPSYGNAPNYYATPNTPYVQPIAPRSAPPTSAPYGFAAYPNSGYGVVNQQVPRYQAVPRTTQPAWPLVQSNNGSTGVMSHQTNFQNGPTILPPQVHTPVPQAAPLRQHNAAPAHAPHAHADQTHVIPPSYEGGIVGGKIWTDGNKAGYGGPPVRKWFGSVGALYMTRDRSSSYTFSFGTGNEADQRTDVQDAAMDWQTGFDVRFGRYFNCQKNAIEAVYWRLNSSTESTQTTSADVTGNLNGILNWNSLTYGGATADNYVNVGVGNDGIHRLSREYSFENFELNLWQLGNSGFSGKCARSQLRTNWLVGLRYFQFAENLWFESDADDTAITYADDELFYNIDIENRLFGFQVGNEAEYGLTDRLSTSLGLKMGAYVNQIEHLSEIGGNLGIATINNGTFNGQAFFVDNSKQDIAFLGELNLGLSYALTHRWTTTIGYRALAITGVAMPADQIYSDLRGINDVADIDSSRALILHGGYFGAEYNW
jgi:Putative beta barrel porin-7 (BBP7)